MGARLPTTLLARRSSTTCLVSSASHSPAARPTPLRPPTTTTTLRHTQVRHATFVPRPQRPYTFTQLIQQSDGSTYTVRTTSPQALYKTNKDTRNHILWQPSEKSLRNVEVDEAGKLAAFRERFGRGWDAEAKTEGAEEEEGGADAAADDAAAKDTDPTDMLGDLISGYAAASGEAAFSARGLSAKDQARKDKAGKKRR